MMVAVVKTWRGTPRDGGAVTIGKVRGRDDIDPAVGFIVGSLDIPEDADFVDEVARRLTNAPYVWAEKVDDGT